MPERIWIARASTAVLRECRKRVADKIATGELAGEKADRAREDLEDIDAELEARGLEPVPQEAHADAFASIGRAIFERMNAKREPATACRFTVAGVGNTSSKVAAAAPAGSKPLTNEDVFGDAAIADVYAKLNARYRRGDVDGDLELADRLTPAT